VLSLPCNRGSHVRSRNQRLHRCLQLLIGQRIRLSTDEVRAFVACGGKSLACVEARDKRALQNVCSTQATAALGILRNGNARLRRRVATVDSVVGISQNVFSWWPNGFRWGVSCVATCIRLRKVHATKASVGNECRSSRKRDIARNCAGSGVPSGTSTQRMLFRNDTARLHFKTPRSR
jgi:hypothetical protein